MVLYLGPVTVAESHRNLLQMPAPNWKVFKEERLE